MDDRGTRASGTYGTFNTMDSQNEWKEYRVLSGVLSIASPYFEKLIFEGAEGGNNGTYEFKFNCTKRVVIRANTKTI